MGNINVEKATRDTASLDILLGAQIAGIVPKNYQDNGVITEVYIEEYIESPIKQFQKLGTVTYKVDGLSISTELVAIHEVERPPFAIQNLVVVIIFLSFASIIVLVVLRIRKSKKNNTVIEY